MNFCSKSVKLIVQQAVTIMTNIYKNKFRVGIFSLVVVLAAMSIFDPITNAATARYNSTNYAVNEVLFGAGGGEGYTDGTYDAQVSVGETGVGPEVGVAYRTQNGFNTPAQPYIQFVVNTTSLTIPDLTTATASTGTATFYVKTYLASGYAVYTVGPPPTDAGGGHSFPSTTSDFTSSPGTEQFGMNLVLNNTPSVGANPSQNPSNVYSFGNAYTGYNTANNFKYTAGNEIAYSNQSTGETDYTISYLFNISTATPGGTYIFNQTLVATSTY